MFSFVLKLLIFVQNPHHIASAPNSNIAVNQQGEFVRHGGMSVVCYFINRSGSVRGNFQISCAFQFIVVGLSDRIN